MAAYSMWEDTRQASLGINAAQMYEGHAESIQRPCRKHKEAITYGGHAEAMQLHSRASRASSIVHVQAKPENWGLAPRPRAWAPSRVQVMKDPMSR